MPDRSVMPAMTITLEIPISPVAHVSSANATATLIWDGREIAMPDPENVSNVCTKRMVTTASTARTDSMAMP